MKTNLTKTKFESLFNTASQCLQQGGMLGSSYSGVR